MNGAVVRIKVEDVAAHLQREIHALDGNGKVVGAAHAVHEDDRGTFVHLQEVGHLLRGGAASEPQGLRAGLEAALAEPVRHGENRVERLGGESAQHDGTPTAAGGNESLRAQGGNGLADRPTGGGELLAELGFAGQEVTWGELLAANESAQIVSNLAVLLGTAK